MSSVANPFSAQGKTEGAALARLFAEAVEEIKAKDLKILDVRGLTDVMDFLVLATGASDRHLRALSAAVTATLSEAGRTLIGVEGTELGEGGK